jgi:hypothetical protein
VAPLDRHFLEPPHDICDISAALLIADEALI